MTESERPWSVRLAAAAEVDFEAILAWTLDAFGSYQVSVYAETLIGTLAALSEGPKLAGLKERGDIGSGLHSLHVARGGRKGRHFVICRFTTEREQQWVEVLRILHDSMDLQRHVPDEE